MTKKLYLAVLVAFLAALTFGATAEAARQTFEHFSINVPAGWVVNDDRANSTVTFIAPDESAALTISAFEHGGASLGDLANALMQQLNGADLTRADADTYQFSFTAEGVDSLAFVSVQEAYCVFITVIGGHADIQGMLESVQ